MRQVVLVSGHLGAGKSSLSQHLADEFGYHCVRTSDLLREEAVRRGLPVDRISLQELGDKLDLETNHAWVVSAVLAELKIETQKPIVVDNIRTPEQLQQFRSAQGVQPIHVHLFAPRSDLLERFKNRPQNQPVPTEDYSDADSIKTEKDIEFFKNDADVRINTTKNDGRDILARVAARLGLYSSPDIRCVDVLVGGQYGSEGKGHVAAYLAKEYDVLVRVGGPNAGHTVSSVSGIYVYHQLPSGSKDTSAKLLLGPGMTIHVESLLREIKECEVGPDRLFIDPQAMIIEQFDRENEDQLKKDISSTGSGSGAASARRILGRGRSSTRLAKDIPELRPYVGDHPPYRGSTMRQLESAYRQNKAILLEGTQGSGLSIFHGPYPHVTSRDTNVAGCLAEAGISPSRVRRILMVVRPTPIRVADPLGDEGKTSGQLKHVTTFEAVAEKSGLDPEILLRNEKTSTTKRPRRVGWFEWEQFRNACALNAPTDIVLTFADYLFEGNQNSRRFEQLHVETIKFVEELERVAQAPVSLINTRFPRDGEEKIDLRTMIDRRNWTAWRRSEV